MSYLFSVTSKPSEHYWEHQVGKTCKCQAPACWNSTYNFLWMPSYQWPLLWCAYGSYCFISKPNTRKLPLLSRSWVSIIIITCFSNKGWFRLTICQLCWFTKKVPDHASPRKHACWYLERGAASYSGGGRHQLGRISSANRIGSIWSMYYMCCIVSIYMMWLLLRVLHVPQWRKNKSENDVENIFYQFTEQSAKQVSSHTVLMIDFFSSILIYVCSTVGAKQIKGWSDKHILPSWRTTGS